MKSYIMLLGIVLLSVGLISCHKSEKDMHHAPAAVRVKTLCAQSTDVSGLRTFSGTIEESLGTVISFPIAGTMSNIYVNEGQVVSKGQMIAQLDAANLRNAYDMAKTTTAEAQDAYDRMKMLHDSNSLPDMQWVQVQNTLKQAQSAEAIARRALNDGVLHTPVSGYVLHKFVESGMTVAPAEPIVKIVTLDPVKVSISIPENEISAIQKGGKANITVGALDGEQYTGTITEKGIEANPITRAYDVKISVANPGNRLMPGMICDVALEGTHPRPAIVLPNQAVMLDADNQNYVWLCSKGLAQKRIVKVDGMTDSGIIISEGISPGDSVIIEGQQKVSVNTPVVSIK